MDINGRSEWHGVARAHLACESRVARPPESGIGVLPEACHNVPQEAGLVPKKSW